MRTNIINTKRTKRMTSILWSVLVLFSSYKMLCIIWPYTTWARDVDFLITKQHIIHLDYYRVAFYSHIFSSTVVLFSGAFLFSKFVVRKIPRVHRFLGRTYVILVLFISAPSGLIMAIHANGNDITQISFLILTPLWWTTTYFGFRTAVSKQFEKHRRWMLRSYALTFSAVTLRAMQLMLGHLFHLDPETQYMLVSWASWILNLVVIEMYIVYTKERVENTKNKNYSKSMFTLSYLSQSLNKLK